MVVAFAVSRLVYRGFDLEGLLWGIVFFFLARAGVFGVRTVNHLFRQNKVDEGMIICCLREDRLDGERR